MSSLANPSSDLDFWEFVSCAKCHLPYTSDPGKSVPFWLTECGHVICNNHLNPDQSCALCGSTRIQLVPLQQQLDAPMADWFRSIPMALDSIAFAAKFQQEMMSRQIQFYRSKHQQIRTVIEKLRTEIVELKKANELLLQENEQLKQRCNYQQFPSEGTCEPSTIVNHNGKRPFGVSYQHDHYARRPRTNSSPIYVSTISNRLTLPAAKQTSSSAHPVGNTHCGTPPQNVQRRPVHGGPRPMSKHIEKFAYTPPEAAQDPGPSCPGAELATGLVRNSQSNANTQREARGQLKVMPHSLADQSQQASGSRRVGIMGPPATPRARNLGQPRLNTPSVFRTGSRQCMTQTHHFVPPQGNEREQNLPRTSQGPQRFFGNNLAEATKQWESGPCASRGPRAQPPDAQQRGYG